MIDTQALLRKYKLNKIYGVEQNDISDRNMLTIKYLYKLLSNLDIYGTKNQKIHWGDNIRIYTNTKDLLFATIPVSSKDFSVVDIYLYPELLKFIKRFDKNKIVLRLITEIIKEIYGLNVSIARQSTISEDQLMTYENLINNLNYTKIC